MATLAFSTVFSQTIRRLNWLFLENNPQVSDYSRRIVSLRTYNQSTPNLFPSPVTLILSYSFSAMFLLFATTMILRQKLNLMDLLNPLATKRFLQHFISHATNANRNKPNQKLPKRIHRFQDRFENIGQYSWTGQENIQFTMICLNRFLFFIFLLLTHETIILQIYEDDLMKSNKSTPRLKHTLFNLL